MRVIATRDFKTTEVVFHQEFYPREKPRTATIEQYVDALCAGDVFPPIDLDVDGLVLLDGYHRWKAVQETGSSQIEARLIDLEGMPRLLYASSRNAIHGDRLTAAEKRQVARQMTEQGVSQSEIQKALGVSLGTVNGWVQDITQRRQRGRYASIWWLSLLGWTCREIADRTGISKSVVDAVCPKISELNIPDKLSRGHPVAEVAQSEDLPVPLVQALALSGQSDEERLRAFRVGIQPYDVWNFSGCDPRFGAEYPGRIPGQLVLHTLYFYTRPGDRVVDPMVGSGTTIDACAYLGRRVYGYDAHPHAARDDILPLDLAQEGWPERTAGAQLIFWDPPYFKKKDEAYGDKSISRLSRADYLAFFERCIGTLPQKFAGRVAFLCSDFDDETHPRESIFVSDYVHLFAAAGWWIERRIQVPLSTHQIHPDLVNRFRAERRLARLNRDLVVFQRG